MNQPSFPERGPIEQVSTNFSIDPRAKASELWSLVKGLQTRVYAKANERYPGNKNLAEAVKNDPELAFLMNVANIGKEELERTVSSVLPEKFPDFMAAKEGYSRAKSMMPFTRSAANKDAAGKLSESLSPTALGRHALFAGAGGVIGGWPGAFAGAAADVAASKYMNPVAARLGLKASQAPSLPRVDTTRMTPLIGRALAEDEDFQKMLAEMLRKENR
jgi:hypothetical protein